MTDARLRRAFAWLALIETVTLIALLVNLATLHDEGVTTTVGPIHGILYVATIIVAMLMPDLASRMRLIAVIPAVGAPLAVWMMRRS